MKTPQGSSEIPLDVNREPKATVRNRVVCPLCLMLVRPSGRYEQASCTHGCYAATCARCGLEKLRDERQPWVCLSGTDDLARPIRCSGCGEHIVGGQSFTIVSHNSAVYGRIGEPGNHELTGFAKGPKRYYHEACTPKDRP